MPALGWVCLSGAFFYMTYTLAYALDSYESNVPEMLIAMNVGKQSISFGFGFSVIDWITESGMCETRYLLGPLYHNARHF